MNYVVIILGVIVILLIYTLTRVLMATSVDLTASANLNDDITEHEESIVTNKGSIETNKVSLINKEDEIESATNKKDKLLAQKVDIDEEVEDAVAQQLAPQRWRQHHGHGGEDQRHEPPPEVRGNPSTLDPRRTDGRR